MSTPDQPASTPPTPMQPIAIVGMAALFPEARTLTEYWRNIVSGRDCIVDVPASRWNINDYYDADPSVPDKTYCKRGGFIPDVELDPLEFGLPPNILDVTDTSQLLALIVAKEALEDAGYGMDVAFDRSRTGVILGVGGGQKLVTPLGSRLQYPIWQRVLEAHGLPDEAISSIVDTIKLAHVPWEENSFPGMLGNVVAGRVANRLDLGGLNCVVDAACASSLSAVQMAISELHAGRCDMILTGGVDADNSISMYMCFSKTPAFSRKNEVRPFDAESDGMLVGEGIGMLVLKRLADAERDHDRIYGLVSGVGAASDGRHKSIYAPNTSGQELALTRAYAAAGIQPRDIGMIEAHGTGTVAGDMVEATTLVRVFSESATENDTRTTALGSVKSQIGHTKAAAGAAGLIKAALAVHHKVLPPTINVTQPHPEFGLEHSPIYVNGEARPWVTPASPHGDGKRRAGVSSFGFGGTNFHVVIEEYAPESRESAGPYRLHGEAAEIVVWRDDPAALLAGAERLLEALASDDSTAAFARLVAASREPLIPTAAARVGFVAGSAAEAFESLRLLVTQLRAEPTAESWEHPRGVWYRRAGLETDGAVVALFPGQGSQYLGMGRQLALNFPAVRETLAQFDQQFAQAGREPLSERIYPPSAFDDATRVAQDVALRQTEHAQPAIGALSTAMFRVLQQAGFAPDFAAGHSFGELTALWAAGALDDAAFAQLAMARGRAMAPPADANFDAGAMLAVRAEADLVRAEIARLPGVTIANENSDRQVVLAGLTRAIAEAQTLLESKGYSVVPLPVSAAFHTTLVGHAQRPFAAALDAVTLSTPGIPVFANATAEPYPADPAAIREQLAVQLLAPVQFRRQIEEIYAAGGRVFVEVGPRGVLTNLVREILRERPHIAVALNATSSKDADLQLRQAAVQLRVAGLQLGTVDRHRAEAAPRPARKMSAATVQISGNNYVSERRAARFEEALASAPQIGLATQASVRNGTHRETAEVTASMTTHGTNGSSGNGRVNGATNGHSGTAHGVWPDRASAAPTAAAPTAAATVERPMPVHAPAPTPTSARTGAPVQTQTAPSVASVPASAPTSAQVPVSAAQPAAPAPVSVPAPVQVSAGSVVPLVESLGSMIALFTEHQGATLRTHEQYLQVQSEYSRAFLSLTQQQQALLLGGGAVGVPASVVEGIGQSMGRFHDHQRETLRVHEQLLGDQAGLARAVFEAQRDGYRAALGMPAAHPQIDLTPQLGRGDLTPRPPLRRGEGETSILTAAPTVSAQVAPAPTPASTRPETPGNHNVATHLPLSAPEMMSAKPIFAPRSGPGGEVSPVAESVASQVAPIAVSPSAASSVAMSISVEEIAAALLAVVSEKTGYPPSTLELDMSMEADLGIDSIKRVEILGAMQGQYPDAPPIKPADLAELRTLGEIVEYLRAALSDGAVPRSPVAPAAASVVPSVAPVSVEEIAAALLAVVSEKTGYPPSTLELDMSMEADLGIDSIKRVEILGAMQGQYPDAPPIKPADLAELRTLGEIVEYLRAALSNGADRPTAAPAAAVSVPFTTADVLATAVSPAVTPLVPTHAVRLKPLPEPDWLDEAASATGLYLLTDDGTALTGHLAALLSERGRTVAVLSMPADLVNPGVPLPAGVERIALADLAEERLAQVVDGLVARHGGIANFVHLSPPAAAGTAGQLFAARDEALVRQVFLLARHLQRPLTTAATTGSARFATVTRLDGQLGHGGDSGYCPIAGGLSGLVKSLNVEWPSVWCRAIDVAPTVGASEAARIVLAELHDPSRIASEVGHGPGGRVTLIGG